MIAEHWLPNLRKDGLLVECPPEQFTTPADWIPLYTPKGLQKYLLAVLSAFPSQGVPSLIAVAPHLCFGNCHPRPLQTVGLLQWTPSPVTRLRKAEPSDFYGGHLVRHPLDHTDHKRFPSVEPGDIHPPRCGHYSGGRASSSYLHLLTYRQISFMVLIVLKSK